MGQSNTPDPYRYSHDFGQFVPIAPGPGGSDPYAYGGAPATALLGGDPYNNPQDRILFSAPACLVRLEKKKNWREMFRGTLKVAQRSVGCGFSLMLESTEGTICSHHFITLDMNFERSCRTQFGYIFSAISRGMRCGVRPCMGNSIIDDFLISFQSAGPFNQFRLVIEDVMKCLRTCQPNNEAGSGECCLSALCAPQTNNNRSACNQGWSNNNNSGGGHGNFFGSGLEANSTVNNNMAAPKVFNDFDSSNQRCYKNDIGREQAFPGISLSSTGRNVPPFNGMFSNFNNFNQGPSNGVTHQSGSNNNNSCSVESSNHELCQKNYNNELKCNAYTISSVGCDAVGLERSEEPMFSGVIHHNDLNNRSLPAGSINGGHVITTNYATNSLDCVRQTDENMNYIQNKCLTPCQSGTFRSGIEPISYNQEMLKCIITSQNDRLPSGIGSPKSIKENKTAHGLSVENKSSESRTLSSFSAHLQKIAAATNTRMR